jgi:hypothetical protein
MGDVEKRKQKNNSGSSRMSCRALCTIINLELSQKTSQDSVGRNWSTEFYLKGKCMRKAKETYRKYKCEIGCGKRKRK